MVMCVEALRRHCPAESVRKTKGVLCTILLSVKVGQILNAKRVLTRLSLPSGRHRRRLQASQVSGHWLAFFRGWGDGGAFTPTGHALLDSHQTTHTTSAD